MRNQHLPQLYLITLLGVSYIDVSQLLEQDYKKHCAKQERWRPVLQQTCAKHHPVGRLVAGTGWDTERLGERENAHRLVRSCARTTAWHCRLRPAAAEASPLVSRPTKLHPSWLLWS